MPRVNVWIPDELHRSTRELRPRLNLSNVLQRALSGLLGCRHEHLACAACSVDVDHHQLADAALGRFYSDALWDLDSLVRRGGTAEGAVRVLRDVALRHTISAASRIPLPRPTRGERHANKVTPMPTEAESRDRHPTARRTA